MSNPLYREYFRPPEQEKTRSSYLFFLLILIVFTIPAPLAAVEAGDRQPLRIERAGGGEVCFRVELAADPESRRRGLMFRRHLAADGGMLFDYHAPQRVQMWMKNTHIPLDMLFIDADGRIVHIVERTRPHSRDIIDSTQPVRAVLELNAGSVETHAIGIGDRVRHGIFMGD